MTGEESNEKEQTRDAQPGPGKAPVGVFPRTWHIALVLVFLTAATLLPGLLSEDEAPSPVVPDSGGMTATAPADTPSQTQALSPQALEDLRSAPDGTLAVIPLPLPEESGEITEDESPGVTATEPEASGDETPGPIEEPFSLGEAMARYIIAMRNDLSSEYVANCIGFRTRNGAGADCPIDPAYDPDTYRQEKTLVDELFAVITRQADYARISRRLETENATLAAILEDPDNPAGLQASTRRALNESYLAYLNGNPSPAVAAFPSMANFINDYNRTISVGPSQFRCQGGPCVYVYSEPEE